MKNQYHKAIDITTFGMDQRTQRILEMVFHGPGKDDYLLVKDIPSAAACVFDLDSLEGQNFWKEYRVLYPQLPTIILSLNHKEIAGTIYVKKPIEIDKLIRALKKVEQLIKEQYVKKTAQKLSTTSTLELSQGVHDTKLATEIALEKEEENLHQQYCGYNQDINLEKSGNIEKIYYDPSQYLQGFFEKAALVSQQFEQGGIMIEGLYAPVILNYKKNKIVCCKQTLDNKLRTMTLLPLSHSHLGMTTLNDTEFDKFVTSHQLLVQPLDKFLWRIALWTARGRVSKGTDLYKKVVLLHWPNFTRLIVTPYALKISALWVEQPSSLLETAKILDIPQRYVFAFFSAASALKLAFVERRFEARSAKETSKLILNAKRSLFRRILARLHI
jgi:hypothetical protein